MYSYGVFLPFGFIDILRYECLNSFSKFCGMEIFCIQKPLVQYGYLLVDGVGKGVLYFNQSNKASVVYESAGIGKCKEYLNARRP